MRTTITTLLRTLTACCLLAGLTACSAPASTTSDRATGDASATVATDDDAGGDAAASGSDACALVPTAELAAAIGADPGTGVPDAANGLTSCTWTISDGFSVLAQYTDQASVYLPDDVWPRPEVATDIPGATRGWASVDQFTILVVKGERGVILNDFSFGQAPGPQEAWTALGEAIAANL